MTTASLSPELIEELRSAYRSLEDALTALGGTSMLDQAYGSNQDMFQRALMSLSEADGHLMRAQQLPGGQDLALPSLPDTLLNGWFERMLTLNSMFGSWLAGKKRVPLQAAHRRLAEILGPHTPE